MNSRLRLAIMAGAALTVGAIGLEVLRPGQAPVAGGPDAVTPVPGSLIWTPERLVQDWPAPLRSEQLSGASVTQMALGVDSHWDLSEARWEPYEYGDPLGDVGPDASWLDIRTVSLASGGVTSFGLELVEDIPGPVPDPASRWIAYGVVLDTDGDGMPDVRVGIDNIAGDQHRAWRTDLASGQTSASAGPPYGYVGKNLADGGAGRWGLDTWYPGEEGSAGRARLRYSLGPDETAFRFYAWASSIEGGRIVATDYAPDVGWLKEGDQPELTLVGPLWAFESEFTRGVESLILVQTLTFTADGKVEIDAGCHRGAGDVTAAAGILKVSDLVLADVTCSNDVAEFDAALTGVLSADEIAYTIDAGVLELRAGEKTVQLVANFEGPPS